MAVLVLYASLYPFSGWHWPAGQSLVKLLVLPWPPWLDPLDQVFNLLGYLPLGLLCCLAAQRSGWSMPAALALAVLGPSLLSYATEVTQSFLPGRHPSLKDWLMNSLGAACGAALAVLLWMMGWLGRWQRLRERWFVRRSAGAMALLALWPLGLLFPAPVPFGLGQIGERLKELLADILVDVPWAEELYQALLEPASLEPLGFVAERLTCTLGLLAPVLLAYAVTRPGLRRVLLATGALALAYIAMTLSTLLNFGPAHALAWMTPGVSVATVAAAVTALALVPVPRRLVVGCALLALATQVALVAQAPTDPYFAQNLHAWEQGRFVHLHGLAQWIGWLWPFMAVAWLLTQLSEQGERDA